METITLSQVSMVLEEACNEFKETGVYKNILFESKIGYFIKSVIEDWFKNHRTEINYHSNVYPAILRNPNDLKKYELDSSGNPLYAFVDDELIRLQKDNSVLVEIDINYNRDFGAYEELYKLIKNREYTTVFKKTYDFSNLRLVVANALIDDIADVTPLTPEFKGLFEIYQVEPTFKEECEYIISSDYLEDLEYLQSSDDKLKRIGQKSKNKVEILSAISKIDVVFPKSISPMKIANIMYFCDGSVQGFKEDLDELVEQVAYRHPEEEKSAKEFVEKIKQGL